MLRLTSLLSRLGWQPCLLQALLLGVLCSMPLAMAVQPPYLRVPMAQTTTSNMRLLLAKERLDNGDLSNGLFLIEETARLDAKNEEALLLLNDLYQQQKRPYEALKVLSKLLDLHPESHSLWFEKALMYRALGQTQLAAESMEEAAQRKPSEGMYWFQLGVYYSDLKRYEAASAASLKALQRGYRLADSYNNYGYALTLLGNYPAAEEAINKAMALYGAANIPAATLDSKGTLLLKRNQYKEALPWFEKAVALDANLGELYLHKAEALEGLGQLKEAIQNYRNYVRISPATDETTVVVERLKKLEGQVSLLESPLKTTLTQVPVVKMAPVPPSPLRAE